MSSGNGNGAENQQVSAGKRVLGRPFQKGQSGNPKGRPARREIIGEYVRTFLSKKDLKDPQKRQRLAVATEKLYADDLKTLFAYAFGKPSEMIELAPLEGAPFEFVLKVHPKELP